ncbi:MAG: HDOD domain-containing protein [Azonexus sp.]|nr:HDOD domain-containing protein [Azonexus sp.]
MPNETMQELSLEELNKVMASVDIPACPATLTETMSEAQKDVPDIKILGRLISNDPGMSATALKLANSPAFGGRVEITSVPRAVERLGTKNIVCVVVASALRNSITGLPAAWLEHFWRRNSTLATAAALVARKQYGLSPDLAYTYTLFHDAAIPLIMKRFPEYQSFLTTCHQEGRMLAEAEAAQFPCTHPVVGSLLTRNWGLPRAIGQAIRFHHDKEAYSIPESTLPATALSLIAVTQVAEHLLTEIQDEVDIEVGDFLFNKATEHLGLSVDDLDRLQEAIRELLLETA